MLSQPIASFFFPPNATSTRVLYTPSPFAYSSLPYLQETGRLEVLAGHTSRHVYLASFLFFMVHDGKCELVFEGKTYALEAGDCAFLECKKDYYHQTDKSEMWTL